MSTIPFPQSGGHIIGQPFTITSVAIPVNATIRCNCGGSVDDLQIVSSAPVMCTGCQRTYIVSINPKNGQLAVGISEPQKAVVVS